MIRRRLGELLLLLGTLVVLALLIGIGELAVRIFSSLELVGNSRNLFVRGAWGESHGNAPNVEGISFGQRVYTDEHGFRVPYGGVREDEGKPQAILLVGDSVGFGPGVDEPEIYAGLLRARFPSRRIYNASVIGFSTPDYRNFIDAFVPLHPEVSAVVLVYCLNDIATTAAGNIQRSAGGDAGSEQSLTERLRSWTWISDANDFLRSRSKLYLFVRHHLLGTQTRDWKEALRLYGEDRTADVERAVGDIAEVAALLRQRAIPLAVVIAPFEYQLREPEDPDAQVPQRKLVDLFARAGVDPVDPRPAFDASRPSSDYYLTYDAMHFSAAGHRVMADVISGVIGDGLAAAPRAKR